MNAELEEIKTQLVRIEAALTNSRAEKPTVSRDEAMVMTGHGSDSAFYRWAAANLLYPCAPGTFITKQVTEALYRAALRARSAAKQTAAAR